MCGSDDGIRTHEPDPIRLAAFQATPFDRSGTSLEIKPLTAKVSRAGGRLSGRLCMVGKTGIEPATAQPPAACSTSLSYFPRGICGAPRGTRTPIKWTRIPLLFQLSYRRRMLVKGGVWCPRRDSNSRPQGSEPCALIQLSYVGEYGAGTGDLNPGPTAYKAVALPAELYRRRKNEDGAARENRPGCPRRFVRGIRRS